MTAKSKKVLICVSEPLLKKLDTAARKNSRNRSAELCLRLSDSLKTKRAPKSGAAA
jgi:hypothetical protein